MRNLPPTVLWTIKLTFTVCLSIFFVQLIAREYGKIKKEQNPYASYYVLDRRKVDAKARLFTLNGLIPGSFDYLLAFADKKEQFSAEKFEEYLRYYKKVVDYMPQRADAWGMVGYCSYYLNRPDQAILALTQAAALNPQFLEFQYNLGVIYFKLGMYRQAAEVLEKAVRIHPKSTLDFIMSSREIYVPFLSNQAGDPKQSYNLEQQLRETHRSSRILLVRSYLTLGDSLRALQHAEESVKLAPDSASGYYYLGLALKADGKEEAAAKVWQAGRALNDARPPVSEDRVELRIF